MDEEEYRLCRRCGEPSERKKWQGRFYELCELIEGADLWRVRKALWKARARNASVSEIIDILKTAY